MSANTAPNSDVVQKALQEWDALIDIFVAGEAELRSKVEDALRSDSDLQWNWILTPDLQEFMTNARAGQLRKELQT